MHFLYSLYLLQVRRHNGDGRYDDARKASKDAHLYNKLGIIIGIISLALSLAIFVVVVIFNVVIRVSSSS